MKIEWNPDWEEKLKRAAQPAMKKFADRNQPKMDELFDQHKGHPIEEVKPIVQREMESWGGSMSDDAVTRVATAISQGQRVQLRPSV